MRRSPYTSKFSAVMLSSLLAVALGPGSQSARQDPVHGIPPAGADKKPHETGGAMLSYERSSGAAPPKAERVDSGNPVSLHSNALQFGPHADINFPHPIPLPLYFPGYFDKQKDAAVREAQPKDVDRAGSPVKPLELFRRKRSMDSIIKAVRALGPECAKAVHHDKSRRTPSATWSPPSILSEQPSRPRGLRPLRRWEPGARCTTADCEDNKGDNGDHPLADEHDAQVHCWNEADVFDFVLPASEVAKHFPHEFQHQLSCNTTCMAKVPGHDVCAQLKSGCTEPVLHAVPETQLGTAQNVNKQLASFEKNVERRLDELDAKLQDELSQIRQSLKNLGEAVKEQLTAASVKFLDSLDSKAAKMEALFNEKSKSMMTNMSSELSLIKSDSKTHLWTLNGYEEMKDWAFSNGRSMKFSEKVYIGRYRISWGIYFVIGDGGVDLYLSIRLHKGISDEFLEWPFSKQLKLSIIHPESGEKKELRVKPNITAGTMKKYFRPGEYGNEIVLFTSNFTSRYLERNGYVKTDQLLLLLEMLS